MGIKKEWADVIYEIAKHHIEIPLVEVSGVLTLTSTKPKGIEDIKEALLSGEINNKDAKVEITYLGAPKYRIKVTARDYKTAENVLKESIDRIITKITQLGGTGNFVR
jgi:translation initiation factor 2 subunit 1